MRHDCRSVAVSALPPEDALPPRSSATSDGARDAACSVGGRGTREECVSDLTVIGERRERELLILSEVRSAGLAAAFVRGHSPEPLGEHDEVVAAL